MSALAIDTSPVRIVVAAVLVASGAVHLALTGEHFEEGAWQGSLFALDGMALIASGLWFGVSRSRIAALAAAAASLLTALAYVTSRTLGLPAFGQEPWDVLGLIVTIGEALAFALALLALSPLHSARSRSCA